MQALTGCNTKVTSTRTTAGQFKRQFNGAMEEMSRGFKMQTLTYIYEHAHNSRSVQGFKGAMEETFNSEHTVPDASLSYTFELVSVAAPGI